MHYVKANRDYNGQLQIESVAGFIDDSLVESESEFLATIKDIDNNDDGAYGIISTDIFDILLNAYPFVV